MGEEVETGSDGRNMDEMRPGNFGMKLREVRMLLSKPNSMLGVI